jgi:hypothetical protein
VGRTGRWEGAFTVIKRMMKTLREILDVRTMAGGEVGGRFRELYGNLFESTR